MAGKREKKESNAVYASMEFVKPTPKFLQGLEANFKGPSVDDKKSHFSRDQQKNEELEEEEEEQEVIKRLLEEARREREQGEELEKEIANKEGISVENATGKDEKKESSEVSRVLEEEKEEEHVAYGERKNKRPGAELEHVFAKRTKVVQTSDVFGSKRPSKTHSMSKRLQIYEKEDTEAALTAAAGKGTAAEAAEAAMKAIKEAQKTRPVKDSTKLSFADEDL